MQGFVLYNCSPVGAVDGDGVLVRVGEAVVCVFLAAGSQGSPGYERNVLLFKQVCCHVGNLDRSGGENPLFFFFLESARIPRVNNYSAKHSDCKQ